LDRGRLKHDIAKALRRHDSTRLDYGRMLAVSALTAWTFSIISLVETASANKEAGSIVRKAVRLILRKYEITVRAQL